MCALEDYYLIWYQRCPHAAAANAVLLQGLRADGGNLSAWNAIVQPELFPQNVSRLGNSTASIAIRAIPAYQILLPDEVHLTVDRRVVMSNATLLLRNAFTIGPIRGSASLGGRLGLTPTPTPTPTPTLLRSAAARWSTRRRVSSPSIARSTCAWWCATTP